ncbi:hypothetical protein RLCC275e_01265 [Rhizobium brockwellii]|nr:hypothetical protein KS05_14970 [Rhizobium brockwellii]QND16810.1 hypothetical protein HB775_18390 [Rhizobium leguminosarum bv. trifolii]TAX99396.1 hypothetical protein ELH94_01285 [Rhizobium leguminosarum]QJX07842.1 hypothetical protein RLCC275e_01265 [Rhizobium brockwellii]TAZ01463.1 hypothetical protein ELH79_01290 [Rhizobium leguminosarum]
MKACWFDLSLQTFQLSLNSRTASGSTKLSKALKRHPICDRPIQESAIGYSDLPIGRALFPYLNSKQSQTRQQSDKREKQQKPEIADYPL